METEAGQYCLNLQILLCLDFTMTCLLSSPQLGVCHLLQRETRSTSINQEARQVYSVKCTEEPWQSSDRR